MHGDAPRRDERRLRKKKTQPSDAEHAVECDERSAGETADAGKEGARRACQCGPEIRIVFLDDSRIPTMLMLIAFAAAAAVTNAPALAPIDSVQPASAQADACSLLTEDQVSAALEVKAGAGQHITPSSTKTCLWSDQLASRDHRSVTLSCSPPASFDVGKQISNPTAESVSGVGDGAYYEFMGKEDPGLVVKKGSTVFMIRVLNGVNLKAMSIDARKAKELELAKLAAAKL
jgi:hypothetical protein